MKKDNAALRAEVCGLAERRTGSLNNFVGSLGVRYRELRISEAKLKKWLKIYREAKKSGADIVEAFGDGRGRPAGIKAITNEHEKTIMVYLARRDIKPTVVGIYDSCKMLHDDFPSCRTLDRWIEKWKRDNHIEDAYLSNPDKAKGRFLPAFGSASEAYGYANSAWELDATVADVMCSDGKRWTLYGCIDVYSRRVVVTMEKGTSSYGVSRNLREAMLKFGVPELLITDNGRDYVSNHIDDMCLRLGVGKKEVEPFSGQKKPHIERFFGSLSRGLFTKIQGYVGASVAERSALVARRTFEQRLQSIELWKAKKYSEESFAKAMLKKENSEMFVELPIDSEELKEKIAEWMIEYESIKVHRGIKSTPMAKWNSSSVERREVKDIRMLDLMMGVSSTRVVSKSGIKMKVDGIDLQYAHSALVAWIGLSVKVITDDSLACVYVYDLDNGAFICEAMDWAINHAAQRDSIKEAHREHRNIIKRVVAKQKAADEAKERLDAITNEIYSAKVNAVVAKKEPKEAEVKQKEEVQGVKVNGVKRYSGLVERFEDKLKSETWNEKDDALAKANPELYEVALSRVENLKLIC